MKHTLRAAQHLLRARSKLVDRSGSLNLEALSNQHFPHQWRSAYSTAASCSQFNRKSFLSRGRVSAYSKTSKYSSASSLDLLGTVNQSRQFCAQPAKANNDSGGEVVPVPEMGESITEGTVAAWEKKIGERVEADDVVAQLETDKITVDVRSPRSGELLEILAEEGETRAVGEPLFKVGDGEGFTKSKPKKEVEEESSTSTPQGKEEGDEDTEVVETEVEYEKDDKPDKRKSMESGKPEQSPASTEETVNLAQSGERRVAMTRMRKRIAERLKEAQNTAAMLTTFNEVDMSELMNMRKEFKEAFEKKHGAKLGFMSAFVKASAVALKEQPEVNAFIDGNDIVYRDYVDISVAVSTQTGLVVPVIRSCENMNFADIEKTIVTLGERARSGKISIEEMQGGTFTISNGGVFGSLLSTPIINMPQSAILGMHIIQKRPVAIKDQVVIRPMMYLALSYDHRLIDGREAVTFLRRLKTLIEDPRRLLLEIDI